MKLKTALYKYCKENNLEDISCLIHLSILNYISNDKTNTEWINISPFIISTLLGLEEQVIKKMLFYLSKDYSHIISKDYRFFCPNTEEFCDSIMEKDFQEEEYFITSCIKCNNEHEFEYDNLENYKYEIAIIGNKLNLIKELQLSDADILKELFVINTNENTLDKLANLIVEQISQVKTINKIETKKGVLKILHVTKETTELIKGITEDTKETITNVRKIGEELIGISLMKDLFS